jgi:ABC-2 type transport system permease protein
MWRKIYALMSKEFIQLKHDRRTLALMILLPVIWLVAFGYAVNFDVQKVDLMIVDEAQNEDSKKVKDHLKKDEEIVIKQQSQTVREAEKALRQGEVALFVHFPREYQIMAKQENQKLNISVDGSHLFSASSAIKKMQQVLLDVQKESLEDLKKQVQQEMTHIDLTESDQSSFPIQPNQQLQNQLKEQLEQKIKEQQQKLEDLFPESEQFTPDIEVLYNPDLKSAYVMIPGLIGLVLLFITTLMTALGLVREKEQGTLEQLLVSPLRPFELLMGKILPYLLIATIDFLIVWVVGVTLFDIPFLGDFISFFAVALLFLFVSLGLGLFISTVAQNQQQAMQMTILVLVPQFILSGFVFPLESIPWGVRWISYLLPLTYFLPICRDLFLKGSSITEFGFELSILIVFAVGILLLAMLRYRKSLG